MISGPSGVGKSSIVDAILDDLNGRFSVSATTRAPRPGEQEGVDYRFLDRREFEDMANGGHFLEWAEYGGHLYGTPRAPVEAVLDAGHDLILDIEVQGARQVKAAYPESISIFIAPPSLEELERRLRRRGDTDDEAIERRLRIARSEIEEGESTFDHLVINDVLPQAIQEVLDILGASNQGSTDD